MTKNITLNLDKELLFEKEEEQSINDKIGKYRKIKKGKKGNYINADKTEEEYKRKTYNNDLEKIYSLDIDKRYTKLIINGYDYIKNITNFELENDFNLVKDKIGEIIYFIILNYILIENTTKADFLKKIRENKINEKKINKILNLVKINIQELKASNIIDKLSEIDLDLLTKKERNELKKIMIQELNKIKLIIVSDKNKLLIIKERKNKIGKEISSIILNFYDFLFLITYILDFFKELSFILSDDGIESLKKKFNQYNIILNKEEFVSIIEIIVMFYLKGYKPYLYKNNNFLGGVNEIVLKTKEALKTRKWSPIKANFKSWLANWIKNFIKLYIEQQVRPLEEDERNNLIYNYISNVISSENNLTTKKDFNSSEIKIEKGNNIDDKDDNSFIDSTTIEFYKKQISLKHNNLNNYLESITYLNKLNEINKIKEKIKKGEITINIDGKKLTKLNEEKILTFIKQNLFNIHDYIISISQNSFDSDTLLDKILNGLEGKNRMNKKELFTFAYFISKILLKEKGKEITINNLVKVLS